MLLRTKRRRYMREIFFLFCVHIRGYGVLQKQLYIFGTKNVSVASESAMKVLLLLLTRVEGVIITAF